jgi:hypothetical protein
LLLPCLLIAAAGGHQIACSCAGQEECYESSVAQPGLHRAALSDGERIAYGVALPQAGFGPDGPAKSILAVPTGFEEPSDVIGNLENIWQRVADLRGWLVVVPAASFQARAPGFGDAGSFGQGPETKISPFLDEVFLAAYPELDGKLVAVDMCGSGSAAISIVSRSSKHFESIVIVPGFGVDLDGLRELMTANEELHALVIISRPDRRAFCQNLESELSSIQRTAVAYVDRPIIVEGRCDLGNVNMNLICDQIQNF